MWLCKAEAGFAAGQRGVCSCQQFPCVHCSWDCKHSYFFCKKLWSVPFRAIPFPRGSTLGILFYSTLIYVHICWINIIVILKMSFKAEKNESTLTKKVISFWPFPISSSPMCTHNFTRQFYFPILYVAVFSKRVKGHSPWCYVVFNVGCPDLQGLAERAVEEFSPKPEQWS